MLGKFTPQRIIILIRPKVIEVIATGEPAPSISQIDDYNLKHINSILSRYCQPGTTAQIIYAGSQLELQHEAVVCRSRWQQWRMERTQRHLLAQTQVAYRITPLTPQGQLQRYTILTINDPRLRSVIQAIAGLDIRLHSIVTLAEVLAQLVPAQDQALQHFLLVGEPHYEVALLQGSLLFYHTLSALPFNASAETLRQYCQQRHAQLAQMAGPNYSVDGVKLHLFNLPAPTDGVHYCLNLAQSVANSQLPSLEVGHSLQLPLRAKRWLQAAPQFILTAGLRTALLMVLLVLGHYWLTRQCQQLQHQEHQLEQNLTQELQSIRHSFRGRGLNPRQQSIIKDDHLLTKHLLWLHQVAERR